MKTRPDNLKFAPTKREGWDTDLRFGLDVFLDDREVGHILVQKGSKYPWKYLWFVEGVAVTELFRQGIGTALYEEALLEAARRGGRLASECRATIYAISFWEKQLTLGRVEILAPPRHGAPDSSSLLAVKSDVRSLG